MDTFNTAPTPSQIAVAVNQRYGRVVVAVDGHEIMVTARTALQLADGLMTAADHLLDRTATDG